MMTAMNNFDTDDRRGSDLDAFSIECGTCPATGTTACADCVVAHLLANDDGPIDLVTVQVAPPLSPIDWAIDQFQRAGLLGDPIEFVSLAEFHRGVTAPVG